MKNKNMKRLFSCLLTACFLLMNFTSSVFASVTPEIITLTLAPGETITQKDDVFLPTMPAKADIVFAFDLTGSMGGVLSSAKSGALNIINQLKTTGVDINYGVMSFMDYPISGYGDPSDYPYRLDQVLTNESTSVQNSINGLTLGNGNDTPESYTRALYESYADSRIAWRSGAKKVLIIFGDAVPHDNNLNEGVPGYTGVNNTGIDPGRDGVIGTADDLDLQAVLSQMSTNHITMLACRPDTYDIDYWKYWSGLTGGSTFIASSTTFTADIIKAIQDGLTINGITGLTLKASTGYESWLTAVNPASYTGPTGVTVPFDITLKVPAATAEGTYHFTIDAVDSASVSYGTQTVNITVKKPNTAPVATGDSYTTNENVPLVIAAPGVLQNDTDAESNPLTAALVSAPSHGALVLNANGSFNYTPNDKYYGSDSFTYKAYDGSLYSGIVTVTITVVQTTPVRLIDIKPDSTTNPINITEKGKLPVAILGSAKFDVKKIDPTSILLGKTSLANRGKGTKNFYSYEDVNMDGKLDMICHFEVQDLVKNGDLNLKTTELTLTAKLLGGGSITGTDVVLAK